MSFLFAWRYFKAKKSTNAINIIAWVSIVAIMVGTAALILVLSVFNGFEGLVKGLYSSFYTDLKVIPEKARIMRVTEDQLKKLQGLKGIRNYSMVLEEKAMIQNGDYQSAVTMKGVDDHYRYTTGLAAHIINGEYELGDEDSPRMIMGVGVEGALGLIADRNISQLSIFLPKKNESEKIDFLENISMDTIQSSAAFAIQQDFDNKYAITNIAFLKRAMALGPDEYGAIEIALNDPDDPDNIRGQVRKIFGEGFTVQNKYEQNKSLYMVMTLERWFVYGVLSLILVVAAFNMVGALTMLVLEKQKDIAILHALGGKRSFIQRIFLSEGLLLSLIGAGVGMGIAYSLALLQIKFHLVSLPGSFVISYFPVELRWADFLLVASTVFVVSMIAAWLPARQAARREYSLRSE
ncbi:MAG: FtsX-like permease family protein [Chitinophagaceae bacterium]|nr:FtsX-like permease family protein [Chitinophagaceae bacterium]